MSWSDKLMATLDGRATVIQTARGSVQLAKAGEGPPVLAIHGGPGGFDQGLAWCRHLQIGGCEVLAPSRPGYLRTPLKSGPRPENQADLYAAILDTLGFERAAILGFSGGGPSAVHFAARHPDRTTALFLDAAILLPFVAPIGKLRQATFESSLVVWLSYQLIARKPELMTSFMIGGVSVGLTRDQKAGAADWITSDPNRLRSVKDQWVSIAPRKYRRSGWVTDQANEAGLKPLPFAGLVAPTLIAHGSNEAIVPVEHATNAAEKIVGAELIIVEEGHHLLSMSRNYGQVAERQLELAHR